MKVRFDATKLKHPNTGLYHFTLNLANSLQQLIDSEIHRGSCSEIDFVVESSAEELRVKKMSRVSLFSRLFRCNSTGVEVQHNPFQFYKLTKPRGVKQILTIHDLNFLIEKSEPKQQKYLKRLQKEISKADRIVAISQFTKTEILQHCNLNGKEIEVIYNGCNITEVEPQKPQIAQNINGKFLFGIGTMLAKKNWHVLPALLQNNDLNLILAGGGDAKYCEKIMQFAANYGVESRVHLVGQISEGEKRWYLENCVLFLFPSLAEGFGLPVIEAMYYGKRAFISDIAPLREVAGDFAEYMDRDFTPKLMQQKLHEMLNKEFTLEHSQAIKERALSFSWQSAAKSYLRLYRELAEEKK